MDRTQLIFELIIGFEEPQKKGVVNVEPVILLIGLAPI